MKYKGFTMVPDSVVKKHGAIAGLVFGKIDRYCEWSAMGICTASNKRLADELSLGESTIRKYKDLLEEHGYIKRTGKHGKTDTVAINEEMVLEMGDPLPNSEGALSDSGGALSGSEVGALSNSGGALSGSEVGALSNSDKESSIKKDVKSTEQKHKERTMQAIQEGAKRASTIRGAFQEHLKLTPNWHTKTNQQHYEFFSEQVEDGKTVDRFAEWWFEEDWRGQQGQYPTLSQVREYWTRAFAKSRTTDPRQKAPGSY